MKATATEGIDSKTPFAQPLRVDVIDEEEQIEYGPVLVIIGWRVLVHERQEILTLCFV